MEIASIILSSLSIIVAIYAAIVANKPYIKKLCVSEVYTPEENCFKFSISNIGREEYYPKSIHLIDLRTHEEVGSNTFEEKGKRLYAIAPGEIRYITVFWYNNEKYKNQIDVNPYLRVVLRDKRNMKRTFKNLFPVG